MTNGTQLQRNAQDCPPRANCIKLRVGTEVTPRSPHRPHRAELPQRVPHADSPSVPSMGDAWEQERVTFQELGEGLPGEALSARTAFEPFAPSTTDLPEE